MRRKRPRDKRPWYLAYRPRMDQGLEECRRCGTTERLTFAHIVPHSQGGRRTRDNIGILCAPCNEAHADEIDTQLVSLAAEEAASPPDRRWSTLWVEEHWKSGEGTPDDPDLHAHLEAS